MLLILPTRASNKKIGGRASIVVVLTLAEAGAFLPNRRIHLSGFNTKIGFVGDVSVGSSGCENNRSVRDE
jgi:hypothetical protein